MFVGAYFSAHDSSPRDSPLALKEAAELFLEVDSVDEDEDEDDDAPEAAGLIANFRSLGLFLLSAATLEVEKALAVGFAIGSDDGTALDAVALVFLEAGSAGFAVLFRDDVVSFELALDRVLEPLLAAVCLLVVIAVCPMSSESSSIDSCPAKSFSSSLSVAEIISSGSLTRSERLPSSSSSSASSLRSSKSRNLAASLYMDAVLASERVFADREGA